MPCWVGFFFALILLCVEMWLAGRANNSLANGSCCGGRGGSEKRVLPPTSFVAMTHTSADLRRRCLLDRYALLVGACGLGWFLVFLRAVSFVVGLDDNCSAGY